MERSGEWEDELANAGLNELAHRVIGAALVVHRALGPGLLESIYEAALALELESMGLAVARQREIPVYYRGVELGIGYRADLIVEEQLLLELKTVERLEPVHLAQTLTYLKLLDLPLGLLINFNSMPLKTGLRRVINSKSPS